MREGDTRKAQKWGKGHQHPSQVAWCPPSLWAAAASQSCLLLRFFIIECDIIWYEIFLWPVKASSLGCIPSQLPSPRPWPACWERDSGGKIKKTPSNCANTSQQQPKRWCILSTISLRNSKHSSTCTAMKKIKPISGRPSKLLQLQDYIWTLWSFCFFFPPAHLPPHDSCVYRLYLRKQSSCKLILRRKCVPFSLSSLIIWACEGKNVLAQAAEFKSRCVCKVLVWLDEMKYKIFFFPLTL